MPNTFLSPRGPTDEERAQCAKWIADENKRRGMKHPMTDSEYIKMKMNEWQDECDYALTAAERVALGLLAVAVISMLALVLA